jgi:hypothetical protein
VLYSSSVSKVDVSAACAVPRWVRLADGVSIFLIGVSLLVLVAGGWRIDFGPVHVSLRSAVRLSTWAALLIVARHAVFVRPALPSRVLTWWREASWLEHVPSAALFFAATRVPPIVIGLIAVAAIGLGPEIRFKMPFDSPWLNLPARWDAGWYSDIAAIGYRWNYDPGIGQNVVFFPAFPMTARLVSRVLHMSPLYAGWLVALTAFAWAMPLVVRLARVSLDEKTAVASAWLLATYPFAIYFSAPYSESLFLLAMTGAFLAGHENRFIHGALWGLLAGLTRPSGWLLSLPLLILTMPRYGRDPRTWLAALRDDIRRDRGVWLRRLLFIAAPIAGMLLYTWYLHLEFGDGFAWLRGQAAWGRSYRGLEVLILDRVQYVLDWGLVWYVLDLPFDAMNFGAVLFALALIVPITRRLGLAYGVLVAIIVLPPVLVGGTMSIGRMTSVLFPLFMWLAAVLTPEHRTAVIAAFAAGQGLAATLFFTWRPLF